MARAEVVRPDLGGPFPGHVAIIMDGNGRWARERGLLRVQGHSAGVQSVREVTTECARMGLGYLTLYAFSVENWSRPRRETQFLMRLLRIFLHRERATLMDNDIRLVCIGRLEDLPPRALETLRQTVAMTAANTGMTLRLALSYGSRSEIADAVTRMCRDARDGVLDPESIDEESLRAYLYDPAMPDPDLIIRTAGEMRISNFLLWQMSYSELYVTDVCWPDFRKQHLMQALGAFARRQRRYGGLADDGDEGADSSRSTA